MIPTPRQAKRIASISTPAAVAWALVCSALTTAVLLGLTGFEPVSKTTIALIFLLPVGLSATFWGLVPGLAAAIASFLAFNYFFIPPIHSFFVHDTEDLVILAAFLCVTLVISELAARVKRNLAASTDREQDALRLYEFTTLLAAAQNENAAARALLDKIDQALRPRRVEILIEGSPAPLLLARGIPLPEDTARRPSVEPLQTARGLIGEIRLWAKGRPLTDGEERLLRIFAGQAVLAIERLRLAEAARKTIILEESDRLKTSLLSSVSHELRSPLAAIKASVSSLRSGDVSWETEARADLLATVEEEIDHLNVLIGNLLDMSRIEAGVLQPQKKPNMLAEIVNAVIGRMRSQLQNSELVLDVPDELPLVNVDFVQMQQVFTNLLANSLKFSPPGSRIRLAAHRKDAHFLLVRLTNQSMPIPEADLGRIFEKFYRTNPSAAVTGSGLGLSICKGIIEAHGGSIWAENLPDGIAFNFTLPLLEGSAAPKP